MTDGPLLWYLNRATGTVLLIVFTLVVLLGILSTFGNAGRGVPRFLTQAMHRQLSLLGVALLLAHVVTAVLDTFYAFYTPGADPRRVVGGLGWEVVERLTAEGIAFERPNTYGAGTGVTYVSVGRITQSAPAADIGLDFA